MLGQVDKRRVSWTGTTSDAIEFQQARVGSIYLAAGTGTATLTVERLVEYRDGRNANIGPTWVPFIVSGVPMAFAVADGVNQLPIEIFSGTTQFRLIADVSITTDSLVELAD